MGEPYLVHNACDDPVEPSFPSITYPLSERFRPDSITLDVRATPCLNGRVVFGIVIVTEAKRSVVALSGGDTVDAVRFFLRTQDITEVILDTLLPTVRKKALDTAWHDLSFVFKSDSIRIGYEGTVLYSVYLPSITGKSVKVGFAAEHGYSEFRALAIHAGTEIIRPLLPSKPPAHLHFGGGLSPAAGSSPLAP